MEHAELTEEQQHYSAMETFVCATQNLRFKETRENWRLMMKFLSEHNLETTPQNLRFAYLTLGNKGLLDLMPLGILPAEPPQPPQPKPTPTPAAQSAPAVPVRAQTFAYRNGAAINIEGAKRL